MISPWPVTSANSTERATGLAELIAAVSSAPLAVRTPNGTPPLASDPAPIHSVSGRPSPSTSTVAAEWAPAGIARPTDGQPARGPEPPAEPDAAEPPVDDDAAGPDEPA